MVRIYIYIYGELTVNTFFSDSFERSYETTIFDTFYCLFRILKVRLKTVAVSNKCARLYLLA